jgi:hypothetical protein
MSKTKSMNSRILLHTNSATSPDAALPFQFLLINRNSLKIISLVLIVSVNLSLPFAGNAASSQTQPDSDNLTTIKITESQTADELLQPDDKNSKKEKQQQNDKDAKNKTNNAIDDPILNDAMQENNNLSLLESKQDIHKGAINFANWVDVLFGNTEQNESAKYDQLRMINNFVYIDGQGMVYRPRVKAKVNLPRFSNRTSLLFSNKNEGVQEDIEDEKETDTILETEDEEKVSAAINYEGGTYDNSKFDFRIGLDSSFEAFTFIRHTLPIIETEDLELKNTNYVFWEDDKGNGVSSYLELNSEIDPNHLFRWKYGILRSEKSQGNEWRNRLGLVSRLSDDKWVSVELGANGNTERKVDVDNYWLSVRIRSQTSVDWLFAEIEPEFRYSREFDYVERELIFSLTFRLEIQFEEDS